MKGNTRGSSNESDPFGLGLIARDCRSKVAELVPATDTLVTFDPIHVGYLTGYRSLLLDINSSIQTAAIISGDDITLITPAADVVAATEFLPAGSTVIGYGRFYADHPHSNGSDTPMDSEWHNDFRDAVSYSLRKLGARIQRCGLDGGSSDCADLVRASRGGDDFVDIRRQLIRSRQTKLPSEIAHLAKGAATVESAIERAASLADRHTTEWDLASVAASAIFATGGVPRSLVIATGERSACADIRPSHRLIREGDILRFDISACFGGYWIDLARTFVLGSATREQQNTYGAIKSGIDAELACIRAGIPARKVFRTAVDTIRAAGLPSYRRHHCGHGIGIAAVEAPIISEDDVTTIQAGMVLSLETPFYRPGWGGMSVEDMILVNEAGVVRLSAATQPFQLQV